MEVDGSGAEEQLGGDLAVGKPLCDKGSDLSLLGRERHAGGGIPFPGGLTGGPEFQLGPLHPWFGAQVLKGLQGGPQLLPGIDPAAGPAQELPVGEVGAGPFEGPVLAGLGSKSLGEEFFGCRRRILLRGKQCPPVGDNPAGVRGVG